MPTDLLAALERALAVTPTLREDEAAIELAKKYARMIDANEEMLLVLGRGYRETLVELGMTPKVRSALTKGDQASPQSSPIDELRARRQKRAK